MEPEKVKQTKRTFPGGPGPGRPKGVPNKNTGAIKDMILEALSESGGVDYLVARANDPKTSAAFLGLVGKVLPMQIQQQVDMNGSVEINVRFGSQR